MKTIVKSLTLFLILALAAAGCQKDTGEPDVLLKKITGADAECAAVGSDCAYAFKVEPWEEYAGDDGIFIQNGTYKTPVGNTITISNADGHSFHWTSNYPVCEVIVKAGNGGPIGGGLYVFSGGNEGDVTYSDKAISHVTFCYGEPELIITVKTYYKSLAGAGYCVSSGPVVYSSGAWCANWLWGINDYPFTTPIDLHTPGTTQKLGEVNMVNGKIVVKLNEGLTIDNTYIFIGTEYELLSNLSGGCPIYWVTYNTGWMFDGTDGNQQIFDPALND